MIPRWLAIFTVVGLIVWLFTDPAGMADAVTTAFTNVVTFFKNLG